ncbi:MAG: ABC transporter permease [Thermodesulfobacteriota bacterium]|nr:ABC transporter permease [Thermodesulfobacteriota bacterium]
MLRLFNFLGSLILDFIKGGRRTAEGFIEESGRITLLFIKTVIWIFRPPLNFKNVTRQMEEVGINSTPVVLIMAIFTGMVLALQSFSGFRRFNAEAFVGTVVALSMVRELGPVLSGLMVSGRVGAAMAAELGTMQVTEQIDALRTLATNPIKYLIVPRFLATLFVMPILVILSDIIGIIGGYFVSVRLLGTNATTYWKRTWDYMELDDVYVGLFKACIFGIIIATISCYQGFYTEGGAEGVGKATTRAVVLSSLTILISNYFITAFMF